VLGTQETPCIVIARLLERDKFYLYLTEFDKPWVIHLRETSALGGRTLYTRIEACVDISHEQGSHQILPEILLADWGLLRPHESSSSHHPSTSPVSSAWDDEVNLDLSNPETLYFSTWAVEVLMRFVLVMVVEQWRIECKQGCISTEQRM
jgi:hypothetical protein